jgi:hypothetical protein
MSQLPENWSIDVEADQVVVRVPRTTRHEHNMTAQEARALGNELGITYLAASGVLGAGDRDAVRPALKEYTTRSVPALGLDAYAQEVYEANLDAGYAQLAGELSTESVEDPGAADQEPRPSPGRGYEVRDYRDDAAGGPRVEVWLTEWHWPVVRADEYAGGWLVLVDSKVA